MTRRAAIFAIVLCAMPTVTVAEPATPAPGSDLRAALLDTVRPLVEYDLGAPVEFVVTELLVEGDLAFGRLTAQRPGGGDIDMATSPMVVRRHVPIDLIDGPRIEVFFARTDGHWYVYEYALGATDAWWFGFECALYAPFLPAQAC